MTSVALEARTRWAMSVEARALVVLTAALTVFGLAFLYSASAIVAMQNDHASWFFVTRQAMGVCVGVIAFGLAAKVDAERLQRLAWPLMFLTIALMLITVLPFTTSIAPVRNGSRRFVLGASLQPSELGKLAVVVWTSMMVVKKGDKMRRLTKGLLPILLVTGVLDLAGHPAARPVGRADVHADHGHHPVHRGRTDRPLRGARSDRYAAGLGAAPALAVRTGQAADVYR
jgi:cell division protein FtsW